MRSVNYPVDPPGIGRTIRRFAMRSLSHDPETSIGNRYSDRQTQSPELETDCVLLGSTYRALETVRFMISRKLAPVSLS